MKDGSLSPSIAKQVRFLDLGKDAKPTEAHFAFVKRFLSEYYPARIAKAGDDYGIARPNAEKMEAFARLMQCRVKGSASIDPEIDPEPENGDLSPPPASDPKAGDKALVVSMRNQGHSQRQMSRMTKIPRSTIQRWLSEVAGGPPNSNINTFLGISWATPSAPDSAETLESPKTRTTPAFEAENPNVTPNVTSDVTSNKKDVTLRSQILRLLATGEKRTGKIVDAIDGKRRVAIMNELKRLVDASEVIKPKRGIYNLKALFQHWYSRAARGLNPGPPRERLFR